ncbi:MAG: hypothetical protein LBL24_01340 [Bacteroidales bacterium]|nr:hypothetical protein [Bacteroidales bacterium]
MATGYALKNTLNLGKNVIKGISRQAATKRFYRGNPVRRMDKYLTPDELDDLAIRYNQGNAKERIVKPFEAKPANQSQYLKVDENTGRSD